MLTQNRINLSRVRMESAKEDLQTAVENLEQGRYKASNNRAYYAIFHAIRAVLALDGVDFKTHGQVIGNFNKDYINTGLIDRSFSTIIKTASKSRTSSDYEDFYEATKEEAESNISGTNKLLESVERLIETRLATEYIQKNMDEYCDKHGDMEAEEQFEDEDDLEH